MLAAEAVPLLLGLIFGMPAFVIALVVSNTVLLVKYRDQRTPEDREFDIVEREAEKVRRTDPAAADRMLDAYFQEAGERADKERVELRARASVDLGAARRLTTMLRQEMDGHQVMRERFLSRVSAEERGAAEAMIDQREQQTQLELQDLERTILRLKG
jgi:flagellar biosynthesis component FlhA